MGRLGFSGVLLSIALTGCTSVRLVQRDGCWVRQTTKLGTVREDIGPCARPAAPWVEDRFTRLVQECTSRADYRWQTRALTAWGRGEPLPAQASEESVLRECLSETSRLVVAENDALRQRLKDVGAERDALRARTDEDRSHLRSTADRITELLGEAAKKSSVPATATATATSDGRARTEGTTSTSAQPAAAAGPAPIMVVGVGPAPAGQLVCAPAARTPARAARVEKAVKRGAPARAARAAAAGDCPSPDDQADPTGTGPAADRDPTAASTPAAGPGRSDPVPAAPAIAAPVGAAAPAR